MNDIMHRIAIVVIGMAISLTTPLYAQAEGDFDAFDEFDAPIKAQHSRGALETYNRAMFAFNDKGYEYVLFPITRGYRAVVPKPARRSISRALYNVQAPIRFINSALQKKGRRAGLEASRFVVNSTVGLFGLFDPASAWFHLPKPPAESFGQTLGYYGMPQGPYIVLPFIGPSTLRDTLGFGANLAVDSVNYIDSNTAIVTYHSVRTIDLMNQQMDNYTQFKEASIDFYSFMRDAYIQRQRRLIAD